MSTGRLQKKKKDPDISLRAKAERRLAQTAGVSAEMETKTPEGLIHELLVHQIEFEMQNEELRSARIELEETRDKYMDLYDFAPVAYFTFTRDGLINELNLTGAAFLGIERQKLINAVFRHFVVPEDYEKWERHLISVFELGVKQVSDLQLRRTDGSLFWARSESIRLDSGNSTFFVRTAMVDISGVKAAEDEKEKLITELKDALANVRTLSEMLPICSCCKKIRDDKGYWEGVEMYISKHTDTVFSHGLCPECFEKTMNDFEEFRKKKPGL